MVLVGTLKEYNGRVFGPRIELVLSMYPIPYLHSVHGAHWSRLVTWQPECRPDISLSRKDPVCSRDKKVLIRTKIIKEERFIAFCV